VQVLGSIGDLANLGTENRENLVAAINEVLDKVGSGGGNVDLSGYVKSVNGVKPDPETGDVKITIPDTGQNGNGLSTTAAALLVSILRNARYDTDQSANIAALANALTATEEEEPDTPIEPDEPVVPEVTLSSISAVYSGGVVAVGTALADLTGIVVTAHYSDGSTETVTDYTLSGEIAEGENIITVAYEGKTATFVVVGTAEAEDEPDWPDDKFYFTLAQGKISSTASSDYLVGATNRVSYVGVDCTLTPGKTYRLIGVDGVKYGVQTITESGYAKIQSGTDLVGGNAGDSNADKLDSGWQASGYEFVADDAAVCAWLTAAFESGRITPEQAMPVYLQEVE
jgi:hypothetical protein